MRRVSFEACDVVGQLVAIVVEAGGLVGQWIALGLADVKDARPAKADDSAPLLACLVGPLDNDRCEDPNRLLAAPDVPT